MITTSFWETLAAIIAAVGGCAGALELIKWRYTRRAGRRKAGAEADAATFAVLRDTNIFLQEQLRNTLERHTEQTQLVRRLNCEIMELTRRKAAIELELTLRRCDDLTCPRRRPPLPITPAEGAPAETVPAETVPAEAR